jgi:RluA family pseudouridine synthase
MVDAREPHRRFDEVERIDGVLPRETTVGAALSVIEAECGLDEARWAAALWHGGLHVGRRRIVEADLSEPVAAGTSWRVYAFREPPEIPALRADAILHADDHVVVVDKPAGLPVQGTRASVRLSLEALVRARTRRAWLSPAHRLDRSTSGVLVFAATPAVAADLHRQFRARTVSKRYEALVSPPPDRSEWTVSGPMVRVPHPRHSRFELAHSASDGLESETVFRCLESTASTGRVEARPVTGRTHQIRVHLAAGGTPILGDDLYGGAPAARLMLHAREVALAVAGRRRRFRSGEPTLGLMLEPSAEAAVYLDVPPSREAAAGRQGEP